MAVEAQPAAFMNDLRFYFRGNSSAAATRWFPFLGGGTLVLQVSESSAPNIIHA